MDNALSVVVAKKLHPVTSCCVSSCSAAQINGDFKCFCRVSVFEFLTTIQHQIKVQVQRVPKEDFSHIVQVFGPSIPRSSVGKTLQKRGERRRNGFISEQTLPIGTAQGKYRWRVSSAPTSFRNADIQWIPKKYRWA